MIKYHAWKILSEKEECIEYSEVKDAHTHPYILPVYLYYLWRDSQKHDVFDGVTFHS